MLSWHPTSSVRAIVDGRQPVGLTSSYLLHHLLSDPGHHDRQISLSAKSGATTPRAVKAPRRGGARTRRTKRWLASPCCRYRP